jgi:TolB-like protein
LETVGDRRQPSPSETRRQLERIVTSPTFQASARRKALLRYLVEEALAGRADRLKGFAIAVAVFGRDETFDPQTDSIVRLEARRLRRDLDGYYVTAGSRDPVRISIPKGAYAPSFEDRTDGGSSSNVSGDTATGTLPPATAETADRAGDPATEHRWRRRAVAVLTGIVILVAAAGAWLWTEVRHDASETTAIQPQEHGPAVIVLPFEALSTREDDRFLASGITHELITDLMRFDAFRLYSVPASFGHGADSDPVELGRDLGVDYVVKGSVRSGEGSVRISAQLIHAKTARLLWSETYDRPMTPDKLLDLQEDVTSHIATLLGQPYGVVHGDAADRYLKDEPPSMLSYACVLRAYEYRRTFSRALYAPTRACLQQSVIRDPRYPEPWALLGWLHLDAARFSWTPEGDALSEMEQAFATAKHAVDLKPKSTLALQALAAVTYYRGEYADAERIQRQALALNPNDPEILAQLGWRLAVRGRWDEGLGYLGRAIDRTISPPGWYYTLFAVHDYVHGDFAEAAAAADRAKAMCCGIGWSLVAITQAALGNRDEASKALEEMAAQSSLIARDPAAAYRMHHADEAIIDRLVDGLRKAGWKQPDGS